MITLKPNRSFYEWLHHVRRALWHSWTTKSCWNSILNYLQIRNKGRRPSFVGKFVKDKFLKFITKNIKEIQAPTSSVVGQLRSKSGSSMKS
mmetsp:Transcript_19009/g.25988  ORF Transcript_19009/g.25988 Transcript_19009/m.25988 type:complete len:91 (+) Transcript_19009:563-835(+)